MWKREVAVGGREGLGSAGGARVGAGPEPEPGLESWSQPEQVAQHVRR